MGASGSSNGGAGSRDTGTVKHFLRGSLAMPRGDRFLESIGMLSSNTLHVICCDATSGYCCTTSSTSGKRA